MYEYNKVINGIATFIDEEVLTRVAKDLEITNYVNSELNT